jgi:hypothetical protein
MTNKGMLIVTANPPAFMAEEFNAWYDLEHLPERLAVPGFRTGLRYVMLGMERRYLALYDLDDIAVLDTPAYLAVSADRATPWTKRIIDRCRFQRFPAVQIHPGDRLGVPASRLVLLQFRNAGAADAPRIVEGARRAFPAKTGLQVRVYAAETATGRDVFVIADGHCQPEAGFDPEAFGALAPANASLYAPY